MWVALEVEEATVAAGDVRVGLTYQARGVVRVARARVVAAMAPGTVEGLLADTVAVGVVVKEVGARDWVAALAVHEDRM